MSEPIPLTQIQINHFIDQDGDEATSIQVSPGASEITVLGLMNFSQRRLYQFYTAREQQ